MDSGTGTKTTHILLLEDDRAQQDLVLRAFRDDPDHFRITVAGSIREALLVIENNPPDLILADWLLPDGKGLDILPRKDGKVTIPLIIITSFGDERLAVEIMKSGAIDYVVKSATVFRDLPHIARRALREWENIRERERAEGAVQETRKRTADILGLLPDAVFAIDTDGRVIAWNNAIERLTGVSAADMLGEDNYAYSIPFYGERRPILIDLVLMDNAEVEKNYDFIQRDNGRITSETFIPDAFDGKGAYLWGTASLLYDTAGNHIGAIEVIRDITERKKSENALIESEKRFQDLFHHMSAGVVVYDVTSDGQDVIIRDVNQAVERIEQVKKEEIIGKSVRDVFPGVVEFGLFDVFRRVSATGIAESHPVTMYHDNRISGWRENYVYKLLSGEIVAIYNDVTEKKQAEERLRESEEKYHGLYDSMRDAFASVDMDGRFTLFNETFQKMVGYDKEEIYNLTYNDLTPDKWHEIEAEIIRNQVLTQGYSETYEKEYRRKDGTVLPVELRSFLVRDDAGNPQSMSAIVRDISDRKRVEELRKASEARLDAAMEIGSLAWWEMDLPDGAVRFDDRKATMLGYTPDQFHHYSDFTTLLHHADYEPTMLAMKDHLEGKVAKYHADYRIRASDGTYRWFRDIGGITGNHPDGSPGTVTGIVIDISASRQAEEALRISEQFLRQTQRLTKIGGWEYDVISGKVRWTEEAFEIYGVTPDTKLSIPETISYYSPDDQETITKAFGDAVGKGIPYDLTLRLISRDGKTKWIRTTAQVDRSDGKIVRVFGNIMDITDTKTAEEALRVRETRFHALIQNSSDIIRILDQDGRILYESDSAERILGYPPGYLIGKNSLEYVHPDDLDRVKKDFQEIIDRINPGIPTEFRIRKADGKYLWVDSIGTNLLEVDGVNGIVITTRPVQQRKEAEQAIAESEERLRLALEGAAITSWDWDLVSGNVVFSDRFYTMLGFDPGEFSATYDGWNTLIHPDDRERVLSDLNRQIKENRPLVEIEYRLLSKDGQLIWILSRGKIAGTDDKGNPTRLTGVNIDITNRKLMESEIRSLNTVLEQRVRDRTASLEKINEALEEEIARRQETEKKMQTSFNEKVMLLKEVHHRVKNNLQIIASLLNLQSRYITDAKTLAALRESQNRVKAMALVHEKLYRSEDISHISLHDYIRFLGTGLFQSYDAKNRGIKFTLDIRDVDVDINAAIPLGLILNELISNSLKYAFPEGRKGEITIGVKKDDHRIIILFRDNGIGIPADLDWRDTRSLGLRLVNNLVDQLKGTIDLDRSSGTQFTMVLHEKEPMDSP
jgi:PAS domain S-box-containing protein